MNYDVSVRITPREGLLDPEGKAVQGALHSLGFAGVDRVHAGRLISMRISADSEDAARVMAKDMCRKLLANPVTEDFAVDVREVPSPSPSP
ncbi:MAG: phosphoribosylformylglycinamidine synthase subunit PurS [Longimicrobiales bacterium]